MLASTLAMLVVNGLEEVDDDLSREIQMHSQRAMQLDGGNPTVITYVATAYNSLGDSESGLRLARRPSALVRWTPLSL
jgi:hypothetical protein